MGCYEALAAEISQEKFYFNLEHVFVFVCQGVLSFPAFATHDEHLYTATKEAIMQNLVCVVLIQFDLLQDPII